MGKGTTVLNDFDVDLVIYSSSMLYSHICSSVHMQIGIDPHEAAKKGDYKAYFEAIHSYLSIQLRGYYTQKAITKYSLQFSCSGVNIDILLSPYFTSMGDYCSFLDNISRSNHSTTQLDTNASFC